MPNKKKSNARFNRNVPNQGSSRPQQNKQSRGMNPTLLAGLIIAAIVIVAVVIIILANQPPATAQSPSATTLPGQTPGATAAVKHWSSLPPMTIDKTKQYFATVTMAKGGQFVIQLFPDKAPIAVNSFVFLAQQGYFNGVTFHRVLEGFMAQGGDPTGTGTGTPGYSFGLENNDLKFDKAGVVAMANTGQPNSNGSQFFITFAPADYLDGNYTIFGQVTSGMNVVNGLTRRDPDQHPTFPGDAMKSVTIEVK